MDRSRTKLNVGFFMLVSIFVPFGDIWAMWRIYHLRKYMIYIIVASILTSSISMIFGYDDSFDQENIDGEYMDDPASIIVNSAMSGFDDSSAFTYGAVLVMAVATTAARIFLMYYWLRSWNAKVEQSY